MKWGVIGLSIWGTNIGPASLIGGAGIAFSSGMVAANFEWYAWVFLMLLAMLFIPLYKKTGISTLPQFVKMRYGDTAYKFFSYYSLFTIIILWLGGTLYAGGLLFGQIMGWPTWLSVIFLTIIATSFTAVGGLLAVMMVVNYLPAGMTGLIIAVLVAALISSVDSGLNSFSTIFTLDIYSNTKENTDSKKIKMIGRIVTVGAAIIAILFALAMTTMAKDLFTLLQSIIAFIAPPVSAIFLVGTLWKKATPVSAIAVLTGGAAISLGAGYCQIKNITFGLFDSWPHFLLLSFYLFLFMILVMVIISIFVHKERGQSESLIYSIEKSSNNRIIWIGWASLAIIMLAIYVLFQSISLKII